MSGFHPFIYFIGPYSYSFIHLSIYSFINLTINSSVFSAIMHSFMELIVMCLSVHLSVHLFILQSINSYVTRIFQPFIHKSFYPFIFFFRITNSSNEVSFINCILFYLGILFSFDSLSHCSYTVFVFSHQWIQSTNYPPVHSFIPLFIFRLKI